MLAIDSGTTVAIVLALFTLIGTIIANIVGWLKIRNDARHASRQLEYERETSNVEVAQTVMTQTVTTLNERLKSEMDLHERRLALLHESHAQDISRLEGKVERLTRLYEGCRERHKKLKQQLHELGVKPEGGEDV